MAQQQPESLKKLYKLSRKTLVSSLQASEEEAIHQITEIGYELFGDHFLSENSLQQRQFQIADLQQAILNRKKQSQRERAVKTDRDQNKSWSNNEEEQDWISLYDFTESDYDYVQKLRVYEMKEMNCFDQMQALRMEDEIVNDNNKEKRVKGYEKPTKNFKKKLLEGLPKNPQEEQLIYIKNHYKKPSISLEDFYKKNQPLYDRFLLRIQIKQEKLEHSLHESRMKQMEDVTFIPKINHNPTKLLKFSDRQIIAKKNKSYHQAKIIVDAMENCTFQPKTNGCKKINRKVESKVKSLWDRKENKKRNSNSFDSELRGISQSMIKTGSFFSQIVQERYQTENQSEQRIPNRSQFPIKIHNPNKELSFMLEGEEEKPLFKKA